MNRAITSVNRQKTHHRLERGAVYTRPWVVDFILDLCGYSPSYRNLVESVAVEPCCGDGAFLEGMARRLSVACKEQGRPLADCAECLVAIDLDKEAVVASRVRVANALQECGWGTAESREIAAQWVRQSDFLLDQDLDFTPLGGGVSYVIGNPPYVRLEAIDREVADLYRQHFRTMTDRADLYVGFYERALNLLAPDGVLGFICADRWMLNRYGSKLRQLITNSFSVEVVVEMHRADAFFDEVLAYPAITVIRRTTQGRALVAKLDDFSAPQALEEIKSAARQAPAVSQQDATILSSRAVVVDEWFSGADPWPCVSPTRLGLLKQLEAEYPPLEDVDTGTKVGIGVATGADDVFLTTNPDLVEEERLLPMAKVRDTSTGALRWSGHYLVNPWSSEGELVDLDRYPGLRAHYERYEDKLKGRHVAGKNPAAWYRTIDKVNYPLTTTPKLLIPDIKGVAHPVLDQGAYYPHHNLYYVTSEQWDLRVLGGILLSRVGQFFIECYAVRMNGGYFRFQAQYLRRIRVPRPEEIGPDQAEGLRGAFDERDVDAATTIALKLYRIDEIPE